jgi:hypothetical protein
VIKARIFLPMHRRQSVLVALLLVGCDRAGPAVPMTAVADVKQLMSSVVEPAAEIYWDAVGTIVDEKGTTEIAPKTDEEWTAVRNAALVVAESGNLLMMGGRARDTGEWLALSRAMTDAGRRAMEAAESRSTTAVFDVGAELYETCTACHAKYSAELLRPNFAK